MDPEEIERALRQLSPRGARVLEGAVAVARQRRHGFVGVEHLAWSILQQAEVRQRLQESGADINLASEAMEEHLGAAFRVPQDQGSVPPCTPRFFSVLKEHSASVAQRCGHPQVEPDDLLIAILQQNTPLVASLEGRGFDVSDVIRRLTQEVRPPFAIPAAIHAWCHDLTGRAERGELLPLVGREKELRQIVGILSVPQGVGPRNALVVGAAGVGKTALIEGLARRIAKGDEPRLRGARIVQVNVNAMLAGCVFRGQFEARVEETLAFAKSTPGGAKLVLFFDEVHLLVGAGRAQGVAADAAQILLDHLGRGELQIIGATTTEQYERHLADDDAIVRRFTDVQLEEPSLDETREILRGIQSDLEARFRACGDNVRLTEEAIEAAIELAPRYLLSRRLPHRPRQWLVEAMSRCAREERAEVDASDIISVVSESTGIPTAILFRSAQWSPEHWQRVLGTRVRGQDEAVRELAHRVLMNLGPLRANPRKPVGVFLFVGPTGVGKTELAKALAELLFEDEDRLIRLDMSEIRGDQGVQRLIGPPRGIVGQGRGELTDRIRRRPYSIVLLDEFEKADPQVRTLFLQVFDEGRLSDGLGRTVYFRDAIIILTSNLGASEYQRLLNRLPIGLPTPESDAELLKDARKLFRKAIAEGLSPELANRIDAVCLFSPLALETLRGIAQGLLDGLAERLREDAKELVVGEGVADLLAERGYDRAFGARELVRRFDEFVAYKISPRLHEGSTFHLAVGETEERGEIKVTVAERVQADAM